YTVVCLLCVLRFSTSCPTRPPLALPASFSFFFFTAPAPSALYTLSLHDALPISARTTSSASTTCATTWSSRWSSASSGVTPTPRSEDHTSELQSRSDLVCRLLLEKKKNNTEQTIAKEVTNVDAPATPPAIPQTGH